MTSIMLCMLLAAIPADVAEFQLSNGIHVITRTIPGGEVEGFSLFLIGGSRFLTEENRGIEAFSLEAALTGSRNYPAERWREIMDLTLAEFSGSYNYDMSRIHLKCLSEDLPLLLDGFADCLLDPQLDSLEVARVRESLYSAALTELEDPDSRIWLVVNGGFMGAGHPYLLRPEGVPETLETLTAADAGNWLSQRLVSGSIVLTHAGPAEPGELRELLEATFGRIPDETVELPPVQEFQWPGDTLVLQQDETLTAYSVVKFPAPPAGHPDGAAFTTACLAIDELLWQVLRTDNALTYATYAGATWAYSRNWGYMYVSTPEPARANELMTGVFRQVAEGRIDQSLVSGVARNYRTMQGISDQSMERQSWMLGIGHITTGDWRTPYILQDELAEMTVEEASTALSTWANAEGWGIIADSALVDASELAALPLKGE